MLLSPFHGVARPADWTFASDISIENSEMVVANANASAALTGDALAAFDASHPDNGLFAVLIDVRFYGEGDGPNISIKGGPRTRIPLNGTGIAAALVHGGDQSGFVLDTNTSSFNEDYRIGAFNVVPLA